MPTETFEDYCRRQLEDLKPNNLRAAASIAARSVEEWLAKEGYTLSGVTTALPVDPPAGTLDGAGLTDEVAITLTPAEKPKRKRAPRAQKP